MVRLIFFFLLFNVLIINDLSAQRVLQIERTGSVRTKKIYEGTVLTFHIKDTPRKAWRTETILEIKPELGAFLTENGMVYIKEIDAFRYKRPLVFALSKSLYGFSTLYLFYGGLGTIFKQQPYSDALFIVPASSAAIGFGLQKTLGYKRECIGGYRKLRLLDLNF
jgi:hypothetical protein